MTIQFQMYVLHSTVSNEEHALAIVVKLRSHAIALKTMPIFQTSFTPFHYSCKNEILIRRPSRTFKDLQWYLAILNHKIVQTYPELDSEMVDKDDRLANDC